ncbi:hypothetical protein [Micromonospora siamensis]|uniref:Haemolytic enterotoxin (HBL) n=1 Tax=Micromonospora siamensis TaxID=299152 RepID=A0A1C5I324_9ACTN|nr:hypothetical protein [Micromonospora siamensis]SCG52527.1 hypothetical protein GA0074704_2797 [Micromonospora siamensis]
MRMAAVLDSTPTNEALADYFNAVANVTAYVSAVGNADIPLLNHPTKEYKEFYEKLRAVKTDRLGSWLGGVDVQLSNIPRLIVINSVLFGAQLRTARGLLTELTKNPGDPELREKLLSTLADMKSLVEDNLGAPTQNTCKLVDNFSGQVLGAQNSLKDIADRALALAGDDKKVIEALTGVVDDLNKEVRTYNQLATAGQIGTAVSVFFTLVGVVVFLVPGAQPVGAGMIAVGVVGFGGSLSTAIIAGEKVKALNRKIQDLRERIKQENQDVAALTTTADSLRRLSEAATTVHDGLKTILDIWQKLAREIDDVAMDIRDAGKELTSDHFEQVGADLTAAGSHWNAVVEFAKRLTPVVYKWQDKKGDWHSMAERAQTPGSALVTVLPYNPK